MSKVVPIIELSIPIYLELSPEQKDLIERSLNKFYGGYDTYPDGIGINPDHMWAMREMRKSFNAVASLTVYSDGSKHAVMHLQKSR